MRTSWLVTPLLLALTTMMPAQASPVHDLAAQATQSAITPIEIKELVIRATVAEVAAPLEEIQGNQQDQQANEEIHLVIELVLTTLMQADRACAVDEKTLDGSCVARAVLDLEKSGRARKVIVRGWDMKEKAAAKKFKELCANPNVAGAREVLLGVLNGLMIEGKEQGVSEEIMKLLARAKAAGQDIEVENDETH